MGSLEFHPVLSPTSNDKESVETLHEFIQERLKQTVAITRTGASPVLQKEA